MHGSVAEWNEIVGDGAIPQAELARLEGVRARTLDLVADLSQEEMDRRPARGGWSVGEVLDHLLKAEQANRSVIATLIELARSGRRPYLRRELTPRGLAPAFVPRSLLPLLSIPAGIATAFMPFSLRAALIRSRLFPASAADEMWPRHGRPAGELRADLSRSVAETRRLFVAAPGLDYRRMIYQHPFLGANDVPQILLLTAVHEERHQDQVRQLLAPAAGEARRHLCAM